MIFLYIGIIILALLSVAIGILQSAQVKKCNLYTEGTIISIRQETHFTRNGSSDSYIPTFKFNIDGKEYVKDSFSSCPVNIYKEGQKVKVAYYKENPMDAFIVTDKKSEEAAKSKFVLIIILIVVLMILSFIIEQI